MRYVIFILFIVAIILTGCTRTVCPESCDDDYSCTIDHCSASTSFKCAHTAIKPCVGNRICEIGEYGTPDCPNCDDKDVCTNDTYNYANKKCINTKMVPCCGNNIVESGESCSFCPQEVKCKSGELCCGNCKVPECNSNNDCNDNKLYTADICNNPATCDAKCSNTITAQCVDGDSYCPINCNITNDKDCLNVSITDTHYSMTDVNNILHVDKSNLINDYWDKYCYKDSELEKTTTGTVQVTYRYTLCVTTPYSRAIKDGDIRTIVGQLQDNTLDITMIGTKNTAQFLILQNMYIKVNQTKIYPDKTFLSDDKSKVSIRFYTYENLWNKTIDVYINNFDIVREIDLSKYR